MPTVAADGVSKTFGETVALADASFSVESGEVFALIGPNGAGKTTLVRTLTGTLTPDAGEVRLLGVDPVRVERDRIGVLPQAFRPPARLTAAELLAYYAGLYDDPRDPDSVLAEVGLADVHSTWYENLSGGQQRRVCVGTALLNDPDVLVLDEPTTGIDPAGRRTVHALISDLATAGTTVLVTSHDMREVSRLADRVGVLVEGELIATGTPTALVDEYGGDSHVTVATAPTDGATPTEEAPAAVGRAIHEALSSLPYAFARDGTDLVVEGVEPRDIGEVVDALESAGVPYDGLSWAEPTLEDVYLTLAGTRERRPDPRTASADRPPAGDVVEGPR